MKKGGMPQVWLSKLRRLSLAAIVGICFWPGVSQCVAAGFPSACLYLSRAMDSPSSGPIFLPSYPTVQSGPLHGAAFLYDNAVAAIALVACGEFPKASRIGDAILAALDRDRYWHDGRLRNAYLAGQVGPGAVRLAGSWDARQGRWLEDAYQVGSDNGNLAWAILALVALDQKARDQRYRDGAARMGAWVLQWSSKRGAGGFTGGVIGEEPRPRIEGWKSTEHNADLAAAFSGLAEATGDKKWVESARMAEEFVSACGNQDVAALTLEQWRMA